MTYRILILKRDPVTGRVHGTKSFEGNLDRACKRLIKLYGYRAEVRPTGRGVYDIARGQAELSVVR